MKPKFRRYLSAIFFAVGLMILADFLLVYLELPQWVRLPMMAILGWMTGTEIRDWIDKGEE